MLPLELPPRDASGEVLPHDHPGIHVDDGVIRRIAEHFVVNDPKVGRRLSSMAFKPSSHGSRGMSVDLQKQIEEADLDPRQYVTSPKWIASVRFTAGAARGLALQVGFEPLAENPHHGEIWGPKNNFRGLCNLCEWFVELPGVLLV